ncbi:TonB family protein [Acidobacteria bacterium ACD]|nr:MAG: TonB family protein [Acidobacteriota bacterium]MDL1951624.1 TonB family protein [Acidobacteria bacterium ACD]
MRAGAARALSALFCVAVSCGCGRREGPAGPAVPATEDRARVSVERVICRDSASQSSSVVRTLSRGTEVRVLDHRDGWARVAADGGREAWVPEDALETAGARQAREERTKATAKLPPQPGAVLERAPVLLAADWGAARWGDLGVGDEVPVVLADHDFYGVRLPGGVLGFVPARSVRLVPEAREVEPTPAVAAVAPATTPGLASPAGPAEIPGPALVPAGEGEEYPAGPLEALPAGARPPVLTRRVDPRYPETARREGIAGEVVLRVVVEASGQVGDVEVLTAAPAGLTEAAAEAVRRWEYEPALVDGRPVAVYKTIRVRFSLPPG